MTSPWLGRRVLVTGHTGFKGSWLALWLEHLGAEVTGFALPPETNPSMWELVRSSLRVSEILGDIRDRDAVAKALASGPEVVIHLAAQSLVRRGYREPAETFEINVGGTANLLQGVLTCPSVQAVLVITSDKVYAPGRRGAPFGESSTLGGIDPYSASKACCELVVASFRKSLLSPRGIAVATARAGNVIGGGDWSEDRLVPDLVRALDAERPIPLRYPNAIRPWQHVLDPLRGYLMMAERLIGDPSSVPPALNFGPADLAAVPVSVLADRFTARWGGRPGWYADKSDNPPEAPVLELSASLAAETLGWRPMLDLDQTIDWTAEWYSRYLGGEEPVDLSLGQIRRLEGVVR